jgi:Fe-S-cluster containining protein
LRLAELQALVHGLADALLDKGVVGSDELATSIKRVQTELQQRGELTGAGAVVRVDPAPTDGPASAKVDCAARLHVCHAVCCRLDFALSVPEVESGRVKWDLGRPYFIRHAADGCCSHLDSGSCGCTAYADRPQVCRHYDCTHDARIWKDFDKMALNDEWIAEHLGPQQGPRAVRIFMHETGPVTRRGAEPSP